MPTVNFNSYSQSLNVRIDDINFGNHLCHSRYINILHNTRALFFNQLGFSEVNCFGYGIIVLNLSIDYLCQCTFNDSLEVKLCIDSLEKVTFSLTYSIFNHTSHKLAARATTKMGFIDMQRGTLKKVPSEFKNLILLSINN